MFLAQDGGKFAVWSPFAFCLGSPPPIAKLGGLEKVVWKRFASGLFHSMGLKIVGDTVYVAGRDQITRLHDLNGDGEADFYENFNNDFLLTAQFMGFVFDLHSDTDGN